MVKYLMQKKTVEERFWSKVNKDGPVPAGRPELGACWVWTGHQEKKYGYGIFCTGGHFGTAYSSRWIYEKEIGLIPNGLELKYLCANKSCVRTSHLALVTRSEKCAERAEPLEQRFWKKVNKNGPIPEHRPELGRCWEISGPKVNGYRTFSVKTGSGWRGMIASRWVYEHEFGPVAPGLDVCHHCDNRSCVRTSHMFPGTRKENMRDAKEKGRTTQGEKDGMHKLTQEQVSEIRKLWASGKFWNAELAEKFAVSKSNISRIVKHHSWTHC